MSSHQSLLTKPIARWQKLQGDARRSWQRMSARDQRIMRLAAIVLPLMLVWTLFIEPPLARIEHWQNELPRLRTQAATLQSVLDDVQGPSAVLSNDELHSLLQAQLDQAGLSGQYRITPPEGEAGNWLVEIESTSAEALLDWLTGSASGVPLRMAELRVQRQNTPADGQTQARVSAVIRLEPGVVNKESS